MKRRLRVLVSAYSCDPTRGSEPGVGWGWIKALARHHDLSVLTSDVFRANIEEGLRREPALQEHIRFHYVPRTRYLRLSRVWKPALLWTYRSWQRDAYRLALDLQREPGFDLVHQLTWVTFREPGHLWKLDVPFVWGPIGGLENTPWCLLPIVGLRGFAHFACRNVLNTLHKGLLLRPRRAFRKARGGIIAATEGIRREIRKHYGEDSQVICETAPPEPIAATHSIRRDGEPLRISWSGAHDPGKALPLLLHAVARLPGTVRWELHILGD
ncbi:MAG: glycosyltransferase family 4 protein, partial [Planctomycetes bacterium]|nr:glycosyltransferase family 4 protein [Planctomycetota bacterium]